MSGPVQGILSVLGRLCLITIFLMSAVGNKIPHFSAVEADMAQHGVPLPQVALVLAIAFLIAGSLSVLLGFRTAIGAALLAVFLILATYFYHPFWKFPDDQHVMIDFMKNLGLFGAMLFLIANGPGAWAVDAKRKGR